MTGPRPYRTLRLSARAAVSAAVLLPGLAGAAAFAQEPLFLRIRPQGAEPPALGAGGSAPEADEAELRAARQARAAREAVWERANARARIAIASVCTGCLKPLPAAALPLPPAAEPTGTAAPAAPAPASPTVISEVTR